MRCWSFGDEVGIVSFKTKMNTIGAGVLEGMHQAIDHAEKNLAGLVIWQSGSRSRPAPTCRAQWNP